MVAALSLPATAARVASHCGICGRTLTDALSIQLGIGPVCRDRHGYNVDPTLPVYRVLCNAIVRHLAIHGRDNLELAYRHAASLRLIGYGRLADAVEEHHARLTVLPEGEAYRVTVPHCGSRARMMAAHLPGALVVSLPEADALEFTVPAANKPNLTHWLLTQFRGEALRGQHGLTMIGAAWRRPECATLGQLEALGLCLTEAHNRAAREAGVAQAVLDLAAGPVATDWRPCCTIPEDFYAV